MTGYRYNRDCSCGGCRAYGKGDHVNPPAPVSPPSAGEAAKLAVPKRVRDRIDAEVLAHADVSSFAHGKIVNGVVSIVNEWLVNVAQTGGRK